jgi:hypothetical protein
MLVLERSLCKDRVGRRTPIRNGFTADLRQVGDERRVPGEPNLVSPRCQMT